MNRRWTLAYEGFDPENEGLREALSTLGNGYFAVRGAAVEESADDIHYPGTYMAGGYNRLKSVIAGKEIENEDFVNFPNFLPVNFRPEGGEFLSFSRTEFPDYRQELDLKNGLLVKKYTARDPAGRETRIETRRFVHMSKKHYAGIEYSITPLNWSGPVVIRSMIDGSVENKGVPRYRELSSKHLETTGKGGFGRGRTFLRVRTVQSRIEVAIAAGTRCLRNGEEFECDPETIEEPEGIGNEFRFDIAEGETARVEKIIAFYSSKDRAITEPAADAVLAIERSDTFDELLSSHSLTWNAIWKRCDIELIPPEDEPDAYEREQMILRLHIFQIMQTVSRNSVDLDIGVPARGLHGEAYRGHIFWDELYILPFYTLQFPDITKALLMYRYRRLDAARAYARENGYAGAMYPWQSSSNGREETQILHLNPKSGEWGPDLSRNQRHVNIAIIYNIVQYYQATGDMNFIEYFGGEMLVEISKFWSSIARFDEASGRYEICGVMGPDEYHEKYPGAGEGGLKNNAYTNIMVVWCLEKTMELLSTMRESRRNYLLSLAGVDDAEIERWRDITRRMKISFHGDGIISQFEGYEDLEEFDWEGYRKKYGNIERLDRVLKAEGKSPDDYKVSKQADVTMLFYLLPPRVLRGIFRRLGYDYDSETARKNIEYYMVRTSHGSTLSKVVFASVLDWIDRERGWDLFIEALKSDIEDVQGGTTREGIHMGAMAGTVDIILRHYAGIDTSRRVISFAPTLPPQLNGLRTRISFFGKYIDIEILKDHFTVCLEEAARENVDILFDGEIYTIEPGRDKRFEL